MQCEQIRERLGEVFDGGGDESVRIAVEAHLAECAECRAEKESLVLLDANLTKALRSRQRAADSVADRVIQHLRAGRPSPQRGSTASLRVVVLLSSYLAAAAAGFLLAVGLLRSEQGEIDDLQAAGRATPGFDAGPTLAAPVARVVYAIGPSSYRPPEQEEWVPIVAGQIPAISCPAESVVRTERGSLCELETATGSRIRLNESSEVALRSGEDLELVQGQIWCRAGEAGTVRVAAKEAAEQTADLCLFVCPTRSECVLSCVEEGPLEITAASGAVNVVSDETVHEVPFSASCTVQGGAVTISEPSSQRLSAERWMQPLLTQAGHDNPELESRVRQLLAQVGRTKVSLLYEQDLRNLGEYGALPLIRFVQSEASRSEPGKRRVAIRIVADTAPVWMVPDLIALLEDDDPEIRSRSASALTRLTGESHGLTAGEWQGERSQWSGGVDLWRGWWVQHGRSCSPPPPGLTP